MAPRGKGQRNPDRAGPGVSGVARLATADTDGQPVVPVRWLESPQSHDYPAAAAYLSLLAGKSRTRALVAALRRAPIQHYKAKDILRASGLPLLPVDNVHVAKDVARIRAGYALSPCLMITGSGRYSSGLYSSGLRRLIVL
jgi:hypothetical protein